MNTLKDYLLSINLKEANGKDVFSESYKIALWDLFVNDNTPKVHSFKNHVEGFLVQLKRNSKPVVKRKFSKWQVYVVSY